MKADEKRLLLNEGAFACSFMFIEGCLELWICGVRVRKFSTQETDSLTRMLQRARSSGRFTKPPKPEPEPKPTRWEVPTEARWEVRVNGTFAESWPTRMQAAARVPYWNSWCLDTRYDRAGYDIAIVQVQGK